MFIDLNCFSSELCDNWFHVCNIYLTYLFFVEYIELNFTKKMHYYIIDYFFVRKAKPILIYLIFRNIEGGLSKQFARF